MISVASKSLCRITAGRSHHVSRCIVPARRKSTDPRTSRNDVNGTASFLTDLRLRAAKALTASLPPESRSSLLRSINAIDSSLAEDSNQKSIGEAVAEAVKKEAEKNDHKWKREKENIMAKSERAAKERVQHDLLIQQRRLELEEWQMKIRTEKVEEEKKRIEASKREKDRDEENAHHPILGPAFVDLGYKRVHITSARALAAIPIWEKQRVYRHDRAKGMATDKQRTTELGLPGIISLHEAEDGQLAILDGQHRVGMMAILQSKGMDTDQLDLERVLVEVFPQHSNSSIAHASDIFTEINKAEPVKLVDMPGIAKKADRNIINDGAQMLMDSYPDMFKPSQRCRSPHLNIDNLRDALFASDVLKRHSVKSSKALFDWMSEKNQELGHLYVNGKGGSTVNQVSKTALNKAVKFHFFLGLDSSWLYS